MLRLRLIYGVSLAGLVAALLLTDGYLAACPTPPWPLAWLGVAQGHWLLNGAIAAGVVAAFVWFTARELVRFARSRGLRPCVPLTLFGALGLALGPFLTFNTPRDAGPHAAPVALLWLALILALAFLYQAVRHRTTHATANLATTMFIILYTGGLAGFLCRLRMEVGGPAGVTVLILTVFVVKITDSGAYFTGRWLGRHKLVPWLSPKKTWEGLVGGCLVAAVAAVGLGHLLHSCGVLVVTPPHLPFVGWMLAFGLVMAVLSAAGDLCASLLKRDAQVKDSGEALPGLGGVLDVLDSLLLAAPAAWFFWTRLLPPM